MKGNKTPVVFLQKILKTIPHLSPKDCLISQNLRRERAPISLPIWNLNFPPQNPLRNSFYIFCPLPSQMLIRKPPQASSSFYRNVFYYLKFRSEYWLSRLPHSNHPKEDFYSKKPAPCLFKLIFLLHHDTIYFQISLWEFTRFIVLSIKDTNYLFNLSGFWNTWITHQLAIYNIKQQNLPWGYNLLSSVPSLN